MVKGSALNAAEGSKSVTLNIGKPDKNRDLIGFDNANVFSLSLDGVADNESLEIPVMIYIPVPEETDIWNKLHVLHYKKDGTYEILNCVPQDMGGKNYVAFCVTSFSDFAICNLNYKFDKNYDDSVNYKDVRRFINEIFNGIIRGYFGANMSGNNDINDDRKFNLLDLNAFMRIFRQ